MTLIDAAGAAERRVLARAALAGRGLPHPFLAPSSGSSKSRAEQAELPELVGDVLADVGDGAVGADDHLVGLFEPGELRALDERHHPAAGVLAARSRAAPRRSRLSRSKARVEEVEAQDVALAGEQVVADAEPAHGGEMAADDAAGDQPAESRRARPRPSRAAWSVSRRSVWRDGSSSNQRPTSL